MSDIALLLTSLALCQGAGAVGGWATAASLREWYPLLRKPWFTPPDWLVPEAAESLAVDLPPIGPRLLA